MYSNMIEEVKENVVYEKTLTSEVRKTIIAIKITDETQVLKFEDVEQASKMFYSRRGQQEQAECIQECLDGKRESFLGYKWNYMENRIRYTRYNSERVQAIGKTGQEQYHGMIFNSASHAEEITGIKRTNISNCAKDYGKEKPRRKTAGGYQWKFVDKFYAED